MTILPKKKQAKEKSETATVSELPHSPAGVEARHESRLGSRRPPSPPARWGSPTPREDPRTLGASHDPGGLFHDVPGSVGHDTTSASHNKRRHRSSPHRNVRKHRDRGGYVDGSASTSSHVVSHRHANYRHDRPSTSQDLNLGSGHSDSLSVDALDDLTGYNSGDEYSQSAPGPDNIEKLEQWFCQALEEKTSFQIKKMEEDGACMFRAVADQVYGDQEMHHIVRRSCVDYMAKNVDFFRHYVTEDFDMYLNRKRMDNCHGNHVEIQALSELYNRPIEVYQYSVEPINTFHGAYKTDNEPIRLSYHGGVHYNSVINPKKASVGVGLGLPGYQPGLADKNQMRDAVQASENFVIEKTMLEDKLRETDWEVTQESIEEQVARESYIQWLRDQEKSAKRHSSSPKSASATCSSASEAQAWWEGTTSSKSPEPRSSRSPRNRSNNTSAQNSPNRPLDGPSLMDSAPSPKPAEVQQLGVPGVSMAPSSPLPSTTQNSNFCHNPTMEGAVGGFQETASTMSLMNEMYAGLSEWDEDDLLAQVIAQSQQEYLDTLRTRRHANGSGSASNSSACSSPAGGSSPHHPPPDSDVTMATSTSTQRPRSSKNSHSNSKGGSSKKS